MSGYFRICVSRAVAFLEFLVAAAWARIVATHVLQRVAHGFLVRVTAVRAVDMAVLVVVMIVVVVAIRAMNMGLLVHRVYSTVKSAIKIWRALSRKSAPSSNRQFFFALDLFLSMLSFLRVFFSIPVFSERVSRPYDPTRTYRQGDCRQWQKKR
ncbi:Repressor protein c2 [Pseudomonas syringae pv. coriandricola]|uniref:Repressor protein c2 n=2 Tax=Pseudomonas syringae group genomosp. 3 TaxID=251701 RepID=A0A3M5RMV3_9PSED|nr:Repressor protein c2 [Pseudomonas syringae pv. antirrhini]RMN42240.1 Repressor protein c2 [Pseudomonas syringae pv. apii]RMR31703.1 Repressor protein c2 [Pseudomonas syringae pv. coriandricola]RMN48640.1 Repressor protein c2 [Pseudomonas syringae pv. apii]RMP42826.1 Repressor protein c2 [Pseudomonas syringae pv. antirrhini]